MSDETVYKAEGTGPIKKAKSAPPKLALVLIGAGLFLLAANLFPFLVFGAIWPLFIIGPGLLLMWPAYKATPESPRTLSFLAVPGAVLVSLGIMLATMNVSNHWESWAYAWTLLPAAAIGGAMYIKRHDTGSRIHERGHRLIRALVIAFMGLAILFEIFVFTGMGEWWPLLLIGTGIYLFVKQRS